MKVLVIHGAGMNMRGKVNIETFGTMTLPEYDAKINEYADALDIEVEIIQSNIEGEIVNKLYEAHEAGYAAALINPSGYTTRDGPLREDITQVPEDPFIVYPKSKKSSEEKHKGDFTNDIFLEYTWGIFNWKNRFG